MAHAKLNPEDVNKWSQVYDFTPDDAGGEVHWRRVATHPQVAMQIAGVDAPCDSPLRRMPSTSNPASPAAVKAKVVKEPALNVAIVAPAVCSSARVALLAAKASVYPSSAVDTPNCKLDPVWPDSAHHDRVGSPKGDDGAARCPPTSRRSSGCSAWRSSGRPASTRPTYRRSTTVSTSPPPRSAWR